MTSCSLVGGYLRCGGIWCLSCEGRSNCDVSVLMCERNVHLNRYLKQRGGENHS